MAEVLIRLKPYNPRKGFVVRRYHVRGILFREDRGWYRCTDDALAERLGKLRQRDTDPDSPQLFDIVTEAEAQEIDARERIQGDGRATASQAHDVAARSTTVSTRDAKREPPRVDTSLPMIDGADGDDAEGEASTPEAGRVQELGRTGGDVTTESAPKKKRGGQPARARSMRSGE